MLIAANVLVFLPYLLTITEILPFSPDFYEDLVFEYGLIPADVAQGKNLYTLITSMFLHGGLVHLVLNMLFLLIAGADCERAMGHSRFSAFYLIAGVFAGVFHVYLNSGSTTPTIGASGAIFGVLAAFAILFPFRMVISFVGLIPLPLPAIIFVFLSILLETFYVMTGTNPHIAHTAHIGGFLAGVFLTLLFGPSRREVDET